VRFHTSFVVGKHVGVVKAVTCVGDLVEGHAAKLPEESKNWYRLIHWNGIERSPSLKIRDGWKSCIREDLMQMLGIASLFFDVLLFDAR